MHELKFGSRVDVLLHALWLAGGTDLLLTAGMPPQLRVHGDLRPMAGEPKLDADLQATVFTINTCISLILALVVAGMSTLGGAFLREETPT